MLNFCLIISKKGGWFAGYLPPFFYFLIKWIKGTRKTRKTVIIVDSRENLKMIVRIRDNKNSPAKSIHHIFFVN